MNLSYVICDSCGDPAGGIDGNTTEGSKVARLIAKKYGYRYINKQDLCGPCRALII